MPRKKPPAKPLSIRQAILDELHHQGHSRYWLAQQIGVRPTSLYRMLADGDHGFSTIHADAMLAALNLTIASKGTKQ